MTGIEIYLLSLIPALKDVLIGMGFLGILACIGAAIYTLHNDGYNEEDERKTGKRICKKALTCAIICFVLSCFIPDRKTIMAMSEDYDDSWKELQTPPNFRTLNSCGNCEHSDWGCEFCMKFLCEIGVNKVCDYWRKDLEIKNE